MIAPRPGPISRMTSAACGPTTRAPCAAQIARGSAGRTVLRARASAALRLCVLCFLSVLVPVSLLDLLDLLFAHPEVVADLVDECLADRDDQSRPRPRPRARAGPGRAGSGRAARCRTPIRARSAACPDTGRTACRAARSPSRRADRRDGSSSTTMAMLAIASRNRRGIVASASATRRSNACAGHRRRRAGSVACARARTARRARLCARRSSCRRGDRRPRRRSENTDRIPAPRTAGTAASACRCAGRAGSACRRSASSALSAALPSAAVRRPRDRRIRRCRCDWRRAARGDRPGSPGTPSACPRTTFAVLRPTPGSAVSCVHVGRHPSAVGLDQRLRHADQRLRLGAEEPGRVNLRLELRGGRLGQRPRVRIAGEQRGRHQVHALVGRLRRENRRHQQLERHSDSAARCRRRDAGFRGCRECAASRRASSPLSESARRLCSSRRCCTTRRRRASAPAARRSGSARTAPARPP